MKNKQSGFSALILVLGLGILVVLGIGLILVRPQTPTTPSTTNQTIKTTSSSISPTSSPTNSLESCPTGVAYDCEDTDEGEDFVDDGSLY